MLSAIFPFHIKLLVNHSESYEVKNPETMRQIFCKAFFEDFAYPLTLETPDSIIFLFLDISELDSAFYKNVLVVMIYYYYCQEPVCSFSPPCYDILFHYKYSKPNRF